MTDITSKNNYYYSAFQYNSTASAVQAQVDEALLYPLLETSSDYQVALSKATIDLSTVPLTRTNIPLKRYQVGLRNGATENTAFVRQLNGNANNYVYNISKAGSITKTQYTSNGTLTPAGDGIDVSQYFGTIGCFFVDDFQNYYVVGSPLANEQTWPLFMVFDLNANVLQSYTYPHIASASIDIAQRVYLGVDSAAGNQVLIFNNTNSDGAVSLVQIHTITSDKNDNPLGPIQTVCADQQIIVGTYTTDLVPPAGRPTISIYNATTFACQTTYQLSTTFKNFGSSSAISSLNDRFVVIDTGVLPDRFIGQSVGGTTVLNYDNNSTFVTGTFDEGSNAIITTYPNATTGYTGYGINTNQLLNYSWNNTTGVTSTPTVIPQYTTWALTTIDNIGSGQASNMLYSYSLDNNLQCLNASGINDNQLYPITANGALALPSADTLISFSTSQRDFRTFACGAAAGGFYALQYPVMPKNFLSFATTTTNSRYLSLQPAGNQYGNTTSNTFVPLSAQRNLYQYSPTATIYSMYEQIVSTSPYKHYLYQIIVDPTVLGNTDYWLQQIDMSTMTLVQSIDTGFNSTSVLDVQICHVPKPALDSPTASYTMQGFVCLAAGNGTAYIYYENNLAAGVYKTFSFTVPVGGTNRVQVASCNDNSTVTFSGETATQSLIVIHADGSNANIQAFQFFSAVLFSNVVTLPWTVPVTTEAICGLYGVNWGQTSSGGTETLTCQVVVATKDILNNNAVTAYTVAIGLQSQPSSVAYTGVPLGQFASGQRGNKPFNQVQNLIYVPLPTTTTEFEIFNTQTGTYVGDVSLSSSYTTSVTTVSTFANDLFGNWTQMTQTGGSRVLANFYSTQVSNSLANTIYVIGDSNELYEGVYSGNNIGFHVWNHNGEQYTNWASVNTHPALASSGQQTAYNFSVSSQTPEGTYTQPNDPIFSVARNEITSEFLLARGVGVQSAATRITSLPASNFTTTANFDVAGSNAYLLWVKNGIDISAGNADIYNISTLIDAVNGAFVECAAKFPAGTFQEIPYVSLDFTTGLVTLHYGTELSTLPYTKFAQMNPALLQLFAFPNAVDSVNPIMNNITPLPPASTSYTQTSKSIYLFNELDKIVFISNTIFVFGSFFGNNNTNNIITDIDVPVNSAGYVDNVGQTLYYQPNFLRPFMLSSNNALQRIQLFINYVYRNGTQYPLLLAPNTNFSAKLIFPRRY